MLARNVSRLASRSVTRRAIGTTTLSRSFFNSPKFTDPALIQERSVPVSSYHQGLHTSDELKVEHTGPVNSAVHDIETRAVPLKKAVHASLTPTLAKFTLPGKVAIVTGAGRGLGFNMAQALAEVGVRGIAIMDVQQELGEKAAHELSEQTGIDVRFYRVDVRDGHAMGQTVQDVVDHYGQLDILINAAGIADSNMKAETYDHEKFRRLLDINITGSFLVAQACGQAMIKSGRGGSIINIASMSGSVVNYPQEQSCYNASKAAVIQLTKSLAAEWARYGIRVNSISPGYMDTALNRVPTLEGQKRIWIDHTPQKRLGCVDDLNNLAVYLASDGSSFMTGNNCIIDGGYTLW
ncbi:hypothetical protein B0A48_15663 [Cryoendolithus antarcticus]|uniref:NADP-dependent mannitol dehydrogenase n=1 Tax=Cryoendolithus antarcticus TaxID=1507870 RepID=A0A1V8SGX6_9PEZI|nr:hypothetical protein B0A48_15663 [Cryoendolithus antarcticus]